MPIRITGGMMRGRNVASPDTMKTRPTASRTREALFNILQNVEGFRMLDLFAGSGIMGLEAVSRGVSAVVAVELSHVQAQMISQSYKSLNVASQLSLLEKDVLQLSTEAICANGKFDLIYADPPFKDVAYPDLRRFWDCLTPRGVAVFEAPSRNLPSWAKEAEDAGLIRIRKYGESSLLIHRADG